MASYAPDVDDALQLNPKTRYALMRFDQRRKRLLLIRAAMIGIVVFVACMSAIVVLDYLVFLDDKLRWLLSLLGYFVTLITVWFTGLNRIGNHDLQQVARQLEATDPRVREDLLSAVELADPHLANGSKEFRESLQHNVAKRVVAIDVQRLLPIGLIQRWLSTGLVIAIACLVISLIPSLNFARRLGRAALPGFAIERASRTMITIIQPDPSTGFVAEGDVVAIVAEISGGLTDTVILRWREEGGTTEESRMLMRDRRSTRDEIRQTATFDETIPPRYAANLSFSDRPMEYQLIAGDAATLWHTLTPLPRPRTEQFEVRYQFPKYAKLDDRVETSTHGDLLALVGSDAELTVTFDQPVSEAVIRYVGRDLDFSMTAVDTSQRMYRISIPIRTNEQYQIDATSMQSGLGNPFSPTYSISPVLDLPPTVRWSNQTQESLLVSTIDIPVLSVSIQDDMPVASVIQEYSVNGQSATQHELNLDLTQREFEHSWNWDLTSLTGANGESLRLSPGDILRTRVIVTDRRGQHAESTLLDVLIADEGFTADRHHRMTEFVNLSRELRQWIAKGQSLASQIKDAAGDPVEPSNSDLDERWATWSAESSEIVQRLVSHLQTSPNANESSNIELVGLSVLHLTRELALISQELAMLPQVSEGEKSEGTKRNRDTIQSDVASFQNESERVTQMLENLCAISVTLGVAGDAMLLHKSLLPIVASEPPISSARLPRYLRIANDRLRSIDKLIAEQAELLPDSTRRHLQGEGWVEWSADWSYRLENVIDGKSRESEMRRAAIEFHQELGSRISHSVVDGRLASGNAKIMNTVRELNGSLSDAIQRSAAIGKNMASMQRELDEKDSLPDARQTTIESESLSQAWDTSIAGLKKRIVDEADLHRQLPVVDLQYAADLGLLSQAIKTVTEDGYQAYQEVRADQVYGMLASAIEVIESVHHINQLHRELIDLRDAERDFVDNAQSRFLHAFWFDQFHEEMSDAAKSLRKQKLSSKAVGLLKESTESDHFELAKNRINNRRWSHDPPVSAFRSLEALETQVGAALEGFAPDTKLARETILRFVKTLSEQAREAAALAAEAAARSEAEQDADQEQAKELAKQQRDAESAAKETVDRLHDRANTADLTEESQRELAHDADLAAAAIESATDRAEKSMQEAQTQPDVDSRRQDLKDNQTALSDLAETLQHVAEHFEKADEGGDVSESREALRNSIEQSQLREEAEQRRRRAEALAKAAESDPQEMLQRLEAALKNNEVMQDELSDIASRAMDEALNKLHQASSQEQAVQRSLERSDPAITELKKRMNAAMKQMSARMEALDSANMQAAQHAGDLQRGGQIRSLLEDVREQFGKAIASTESSGGDQVLLSEISAAAQKLAKVLELTKEMVDQVNQKVASQPESVDPIMDPMQTMQRLQQIDAARRSMLIQKTTNEQKAWANVARQTGPQLQKAQRQQSEAKRTIEKIESKAKDSSKTDAQKAELELAKQQLELATRTVEEARKTNEFANRMESQVAERARELRSEKQPKLDPESPVKQSVSHILDATTSEIESIQSELSNWTQLADQPPQLLASSHEASRQMDRQAAVKADVADAGEDIKRAGRHEQRLEKADIADAVQQIADSVDQHALPAAEQAHRSLEQASQDASKTSSANRDLQSAADEIDRTAGLLQELLGKSSNMESSPDSPTSGGQPSTLSEEQSRKLAKTLDELDRAMLSSQSPSQPSEQGQDGESESSSSESTASSQGKPPSDAPSTASPPQSAAEASPTLASMLENEQQNAARQRRGQKPSNSRDSKTGTTPQGDEPSEGERSLAGMDDPSLGTIAGKRAKENWGELRQQAPEDVTESEWSTTLPQYRREVSAYFRAIAERAAQESQP